MDKSYALSNDDINELLTGLGDQQTKIFTYPELANVKSIDELLDHKGRAIMLFLHTPNSGHWISIIKKGNVLEVFDSYGIKPDYQHDKIGVPKEQQEELGQGHPLLHNLAKQNGYILKYNREKVQPLNNDVNTCGRHAVMRIVFSNMSLKDYKKMIKQIANRMNMSYDDVIMIITKNVLGK